MSGEDEHKYSAGGGGGGARGAVRELPVVYPSARGAGPAAGSGLRLNIPPTPAAAQQQQQLQQRGGGGGSNASSLPPTRVQSPSNNSSYRPGTAASASSLALVPSSSPPAARRAVVPQQTRVPMPGPGRRRTITGASTAGGSAVPSSSSSRFSSLTACFRPTQASSSIFDMQLVSLYAPYARLPAFICASLTLLEACLSDGSVRADQLFCAAGPDAVPEARLQELVNYLEDAGESGGISAQSLAYYGAPCVAAFLLRFLDNLPEPLLTTQRYSQFLVAANVSPELRGKGANAAFKAAFPLAAHEDGADEFDQLFVMQSLVVGLPGAHYVLLQRMILLIIHMLQADALASPRAKSNIHASAASAALANMPLSPSSSGLMSPGRGGSSSSTSVSLQRLSLLFCSSFLQPPFVSVASKSAALDGSLRRAQEQQVLIYLVQHYSDLFERQHVREARTMQLAPPPQEVLDPNPQLAEAVAIWRRRAGALKLNFSRRHFDERALTRVFRAWRSMSRSNRRRAECYRQLSLLKTELLAEKHKSALLQRELHGLREEFELKDFADQLRQQVGAVTAGAAYGLSASAVAIPASASAAARYHGSPASAAAAAAPAGGPVFRVGGSAVKVAPNADHFDEKEAALLVQGLERAGYTTGSGGARIAGGRDIAADLASVRALQQQDRALTDTYSRLNPALGI